MLRLVTSKNTRFALCALPDLFSFLVHLTAFRPDNQLLQLLSLNSAALTMPKPLLHARTVFSRTVILYSLRAQHPELKSSLNLNADNMKFVNENVYWLPNILHKDFCTVQSNTRELLKEKRDIIHMAGLFWLTSQAKLVYSKKNIETGGTNTNRNKLLSAAQNSPQLSSEIVIF